MPFFQIDFTMPGARTASGRPFNGQLIGPYSSLDAAKADLRDRHPAAQITGATQLPD